MKKEFRINKNITLKLEKDKTNIYVNNNLFRQCKSLIINLTINYPYSNLESIDKVIDESYKSEKVDYTLKPEEEFLAHCSNLQFIFIIFFLILSLFKNFIIDRK